MPFSRDHSVAGNNHSNACFQGEVHFNSTRAMHSDVCDRTAEVGGSKGFNPRPRASGRYIILMEGSDSPGDGDQSERLAQMIDAEIVAQNVMYRQKPNDGSLGAPQLMWLPPGTLGTFGKVQGTKRRTGESQFKLPIFISQDQMSEIDAMMRARVRIRATSVPSTGS